MAVTRNSQLLTRHPPPLIAHVDMNTFFVSVERLRDPALIGMPVVVGGPPEGRGVVAAASYEARRYGIHSAMPMSQAVRRCPGLVIVPPHYKAYQRAHSQIKDLLGQFTPALEMASIDEGYLDLSGTEGLWGPPLDAGRRIRSRILDETRLPASVGISFNMLVSKVASDLAKPARDPRLGKSAPRGVESGAFLSAEGVIHVIAGSEAAFLAPLPVSYLPGCGKVTLPKLQAAGIHTIGDLAARPENSLETDFGELGRMLWQRANGRGAQSLGTGRQRKSISKETTFAEDLGDEARLRSVLHGLTEEVATTLRQRGEVARTVTVKMRTGDFVTHTAARTLAAPTDQTRHLFDEAAALLGNSWSGGQPLRLIGVGVSNLMKGWRQEDLFAQGIRARESRRTSAVDAIRQRFGKDILLTGESVNLLRREDS